jgi:2'-5' RNA ligase
MSLYFIGILAPEEVNRQVLKWKEYMLDHFSCKKALRLPAHVTLIPPFAMRDELEMPLAGMLEEFVRSRPGFERKGFSARLGAFS